MEKEQYQEMSPEEVKKFEEENMTDTEREMSEERASKFEQREQMPPILIIYRDNDLFEKYVPEIERMLTAWGRRVEVKNFPRNTEEDEIKKWYKENLEKLTGMEIISDQTALAPFNMDKEFESRGIKRNRELDYLIGQAIWKVIWDEKADKTFASPNDRETPDFQSSGIRELADLYSVIVKRILENQENMPNKVYVFLDRILDHLETV